MCSIRADLFLRTVRPMDQRHETGVDVPQQHSAGSGRSRLLAPCVLSRDLHRAESTSSHSICCNPAEIRSPRSADSPIFRPTIRVSRFPQPRRPLTQLLFRSQPQHGIGPETVCSLVSRKGMNDHTGGDANPSPTFSRFQRRALSHLSSSLSRGKSELRRLYASAQNMASSRVYDGLVLHGPTRLARSSVSPLDVVTVTRIGCNYCSSKSKSS
jgi:hypothetical protein